MEHERHASAKEFGGNPTEVFNYFIFLIINFIINR